MSGIGFILPNEDFTNSPLGSVTVIVDNYIRAEQIASTYCESIGSTKYKAAIKNTVKSMLDEGLWDKTLVFWPILGDTVAAAKVDLKGVHTMTVVNSGVTLSGDNLLAFDGTATGLESSVVNAKDDINSVNRAVIFRCTGPASGGKQLCTGVNFSSGKPNIGIQSSAVLTGNNGARNSYVQLTTGNNYLYSNGELKSQTQTSYGTVNAFFYVVGCLVNSSFEVSRIYSGNVSYLIYGTYNQTELQKMDSIVAYFELMTNKV